MDPKEIQQAVNRIRDLLDDIDFQAFVEEMEGQYKDVENVYAIQSALDTVEKYIQRDTERIERCPTH